MDKTDHQRYLQGEWWQKRRRDFLLRVAHCDMCGIPRWLAGIIYDQDLTVHHLNYANLGAELDEDLKPMCRRCHDVEHRGFSDFKAPRQSICRACERAHYDPCSLLCVYCEALHGLYAVLHSERIGASKEHRERLIHDVIEQVGSHAETKEPIDSLAVLVPIMNRVRDRQHG